MPPNWRWSNIPTLEVHHDETATVPRGVCPFAKEQTRELMETALCSPGSMALAVIFPACGDSDDPPHDADARVSGMAYSGNHLYDGDTFLSGIPFSFLQGLLPGGYRFIDLKADESDIKATLKIKDPYAGIQVAF